MPKKLTADQILRYHKQGSRKPGRLLRRAMIEKGVVETCRICGATKNLQVSHKNGNYRNCYLDNLEFLCPSCHADTPDYGGKGNKKQHLPNGAFVSHDGAFAERYAEGGTITMTDPATGESIVFPLVKTINYRGFDPEELKKMASI